MGCVAAVALAAACAPVPVATSQPAAKPPASAAPHRSAFEGYRAYKADEPLEDWREANERVREAGGHVGIMKGGAR